MGDTTVASRLVGALGAAGRQKQNPTKPRKTPIRDQLQSRFADPRLIEYIILTNLSDKSNQKNTPFRCCRCCRCCRLKPAGRLYSELAGMVPYPRSSGGFWRRF